MNDRWTNWRMVFNVINISTYWWWLMVLYHYTSLNKAWSGMHQKTWSEPWGWSAIWFILKTFSAAFMRSYRYWSKDMSKLSSCNQYIFYNNYAFLPQYYIGLISSCFFPAATDPEEFTLLHLSFMVGISLKSLLSILIEEPAFAEIHHEAKEIFDVYQIWI